MQVLNQRLLTLQLVFNQLIASCEKQAVIYIRKPFRETCTAVWRVCIYN